MESEIEKIKNIYHLNPNSTSTMKGHSQATPGGGMRPMDQRNSSQVSFGVTEDTSMLASSSSGSKACQSRTNNYEQTLNKHGQIPPSKGKGVMMPVINPKELTNEELEYIIKTGQLPPRLNQQPSAPSSRPQSVSYSLSKQNSSERKEELKKTQGQHPLLQSYIGYG